MQSKYKQLIYYSKLTIILRNRKSRTNPWKFYQKNDSAPKNYFRILKKINPLDFNSKAGKH